MKSYFTITDKHLTSIDVYQDESVAVVIESEKLHDEINNHTPKKVTIQVKKNPQEAMATKVTVSDPKHTRSMSINLNFSINWENMAKRVVSHHGIDPNKISDVDSKRDAAEKIFQNLIKFEQKDKLKTYPIRSRQKFNPMEFAYPISSIRRRSPNYIYHLLPEEFNYPDRVIRKIRDTFDRRGRWNPPGQYSEGRVYIETSTGALDKIIQAVELVYDDDQEVYQYPITVEDGEFIVDVSNGNSASGTLPSKKIEGPRCDNSYGSRFAKAVNNLSGQVELHTVPKGPLAIVERNRGHIYRYIIPA
jgi:hypothetical protein